VIEAEENYHKRATPTSVEKETQKRRISGEGELCNSRESLLEKKKSAT